MPSSACPPTGRPPNNPGVCVVARMRRWSAPLYCAEMTTGTTGRSSRITTGEFGMLLGGEIVEAPASFGVLNPATEGVFAQAPECSSDMLDAAVGAARAALPAWRRDEAARREALHASAQLLRQHADELAELFTREQGRALVYAKGEIEHSASWLEQVAELALPGGERVADNDGHWELRRAPRGARGAGSRQRRSLGAAPRAPGRAGSG